MIHLLQLACTVAVCNSLDLVMDLTRENTPYLETRESTLLHYQRPDFPDKLGEGWREEYSRELVIHSDCLWATSIVAEVRVTRVTPRDAVLWLTMRPHFVADIPPQECTVLWNGLNIGLAAFTHDKAWSFVTFSFAVPATVQTRGNNTITFLSRYAVSRADVEQDAEKPDRRRVAFGLAAVQVLPPDIAPVAIAKGETPEPPARAVPTFQDDAIALAPDCILTFPLRLPEGGPCLLRTNAPAAGPATLRWDTLEGPGELPLAFAESKDGFEADLSSHAGKVVEIELSPAPGSTDATVWHGLSLWAQGETAAAPSPRPGIPRRDVRHVIIICLDAFRASALHRQGALRECSPFLDGLAQHAMVFDRAYAQASWTYTSVVSFLSGLYPFQHGVNQVTDAPTGLRLLPEILREAGIATGIVGENFFFSESRGLDRGTDSYTYVFPEHTVGGERTSGEVVEAASAFLAANKDRSSFLYIHFFAPHAPYDAGNPHRHLYTLDPVQAIPPNDGAMHRAEVGQAPLSEEGAKQLRSRYDENIRYADGQVQALFEAIRGLGYADDTAILITSDHGEAFNEHRCLGHGDPPFDSLIRTPFLLMYGPSSSQPGEAVSRAVRSIDLFPTVCDMLGVTPPRDLPGTSLFAEEQPVSDDPLSFAQSQGNHPEVAYIWDRYKLFCGPAGVETKLYDLQLDPGEQSNLARVRPVFCNFLITRAYRWRARLESQISAGNGSQIELEQQERERLRTLGYL